ncbi:hypothetical protein L1887_06677 [Cichorium endivia]|nr:hypothetical protein L1887_06677 [Cichorium endivia]
MGSWRNSASWKILWLIIMPLVLILGLMALRKSNWEVGLANYYPWGSSSVIQNHSAAQGPASSENFGGPLLDRRWTAVGGDGQMAEAPSPSSSPTIPLEEDMDMQQPVCTFSRLFYFTFLV